ncbi:MAG: hypothetical protein KF906_11460 [Actinobacteria bacterium]|nr:hypothetical protein [Actinomycetota bacterium]
MPTDEATLAVELGFLPEAQAIADSDHPGLLRAGLRAGAPYGGRAVELHTCDAVDGLRSDAIRPDLREAGFDVADLAGADALQEVFARVRAAGHLDDASAAHIRAELAGATFRLSSGPSVTVLHAADEGFILRQGGPKGTKVGGSVEDGDHGVATSVHADQDVFGTPLRQLMDGRAPELFNFDAPDGHNHGAGLWLVNLWIPLQQITQPLTLCDKRSLDRRRHQLRYGLPTSSFLDRDDDMVINDIWTFLHDPGQRWYLRSEMDHRQAYVFDTLSTPHGACTLPGEDVAEQCCRSLVAAEAAVADGDVDGLAEALATVGPVDVPEMAPPALRAAVSAMAVLLREAGDDPAGVIADGEAWSERSRAARRRVVRMSLELRLVVSLDE